MKSFTVILALMLSGQAFGQSSLFNVPYRPQPRILIPTVEPSPVIVSTNGTIIVNTNRALRYCDFYLAAVDQSGTYTNPILFEFSSVTTNAQGAATVFYQRSGADWPASLLRNAGTTYCRTNWTTTTNRTRVSSHISWLSAELSFNFHPAYITYQGMRYIHSGENLWGGYGEYFETNPYMQATNQYTDKYKYYGRATSGGVWRVATNITLTGGIIFSSATFTNASVSAPAETNYWSTNVTTNVTSEVLSETIMSVRAASSNEASAIEVYPMRQGQGWMKQTNPNIKWMCLLSNGRGWYTTPAGDPLWFNCLVEWVERIPENGVR